MSILSQARNAEAAARLAEAIQVPSTSSVSTLPVSAVQLDTSRSGAALDRQAFLDQQFTLNPVRTGRQILQLGTEGLAVKALQDDLAQWISRQSADLRPECRDGFAKECELGKFGQFTEEAIRTFQRSAAIDVNDGSLRSADSSHGLSADGIVGPRTMWALDKYFNRETPVSFAEFKQITGGYFDKSQVPENEVWRISDAQIDDEARINPGKYIRSIGKKLLPANFLARVEQIAENLGTKPEYLIGVMNFETGGTFDPAKRNPHGSATGLIQFLRKTAIRLGTSTEALASMTAVDQLDYVEKYLMPYKGKLNTFTDCYMAVLYPVAVGKGENYRLFRAGQHEYRVNRGLDINGDHKVTAREAAQKAAGQNKELLS